MSPATVGNSIADNDEKFDTFKWRDVIIANIDMVDKKVKSQTAHQILERELDDLKVIVANSFDQMSRSIGRQVGNARKEANTVELYAEQKDTIQGGTYTRVSKH